MYGADLSADDVRGSRRCADVVANDGGRARADVVANDGGRARGVVTDMGALDGVCADVGALDGVCAKVAANEALEGARGLRDFLDFRYKAAEELSPLEIVDDGTAADLGSSVGAGTMKNVLQIHRDCPRGANDAWGKYGRPTPAL
jgi:hypothetical protein